MSAPITPTARPGVSTVRTRLANQLGPFQKLWDAWDEADTEIRKQPFEHFELVIGHQLVEFKHHRSEGDHKAAAQKAVDIISTALNLMRWMELKPDEIADIAESCAEGRMRGKTLEILKKYETAENLKKHQELHEAGRSVQPREYTTSGSPGFRNLTAPTEVSAIRPTFLLTTDEWSPTRGGISQFNRSLAAALAAAGHRTTCLVAVATPREHLDAAERGVRLIEAERTPAGPELYLPSEAILSEKPDVVIGHDFVSGSVAWVYAKKYLRNAALVHIVHTAPSENEPYKRADEATWRTEARELEARHVAAEADIVAAVGPRLVRSAEAMVGDGFGGVSILQLEPGMTVLAEVADRRRQVPAKPTVLVLGRAAHIQSKGLDIAANAIAGVTVPYGRPTPELLIRGAPADKCDWLRGELGLIARLAPDRVDVRPFTDDPNQISHDLRRAALCLMPSRAEGFGLAALEAIELGTPVLVSDKSGVAETLRAHLGFMADQMIVKIVDDFSEDSRRWTEAIQRVLDNLSEAFAYTHEIRSRLGRVLSWDATVQSLVNRLATPIQRSDSRSPIG